MRRIIIEVPHGELANLERVTLVEASLVPRKRSLSKTYKVSPVQKARRQPAISSQRERTEKALSEVFGIFKGRDDAPQDGLAFQLEMRNE
jgi:hypothetical protein